MRLIYSVLFVVLFFVTYPVYAQRFPTVFFVEVELLTVTQTDKIVLCSLVKDKVQAVERKIDNEYYAGRIRIKQYRQRLKKSRSITRIRRLRTKIRALRNNNKLCRNSYSMIDFLNYWDSLSEDSDNSSPSPTPLPDTSPSPNPTPEPTLDLSSLPHVCTAKIDYVICSYDSDLSVDPPNWVGCDFDEIRYESDMGQGDTLQEARDAAIFFCQDEIAQRNAVIHFLRLGFVRLLSDDCLITSCELL